MEVCHQDSVSKCIREREWVAVGAVAEAAAEVSYLRSYGETNRLEVGQAVKVLTP